MKRKIASSILLYTLVLLLLVWTLAPILWMVISSASLSSDLLVSKGKWIPSEVTLDRYKSIITDKTIRYRGADITAPGAVFRKALLNSLLISLSTTFLSLLLGSSAAYAFARLRFRFRRTLLYSALFFQLLPPVALVIPLYLMIRKTGMIDKPITLIVIYMSFTLVYVMWILSNYFRSIPVDLEDAARIDGCSRLGAFIKVILPNAAPGFVAVGTLAFLMSWDEFLYALIFTNSSKSKTIPIAISEFTTQFGIDYGMMMTGGVVATLIPLVLSLIFQRYIVMGLTSGAVKE